MFSKIKKSAPSLEPQFGWSRCGHEHTVEEYQPIVPKHLLTTNDPPLAEEERALRDKLSLLDLERDINAIDKEIKAQRQYLDDLSRRKNLMQEDFLASKGVLSPIRRVPSEIIGEIILYALDFYTPSPPPTSLNTQTGPWMYSRVCRLWRREVVSRAAVWANVLVTNDFVQSYRNHEFPSYIFSEIITRANGRVLKLKISLFSDSPAAKLLLELAISKSMMWGDVHLVLAAKLVAKLKKLKNQIPRLERLKLEHISTQALVTNQLTQSFSHAPKLRRLLIHGFRDLESIALPFHQLTHFETRNYTIFSHFLNKMPNLVYCRLGSTHYSPPTIKIPLLKLHTLSLASGYNDSVLDQLEVPALSELRISVAGLDPEQVAGFVRTSRCTIRTLVLHFYRYIPLDVYPLIAGFGSTIRDLRLVNASPLPALVNKLRPDVLPELEKLTVYASCLSTKIREGWEPVLRAVEAFLEVDSPTLKELHFQGRTHSLRHEYMKHTLAKFTSLHGLTVTGPTTLREEDDSGEDSELSDGSALSALDDVEFDSD